MKTTPLLPLLAASCVSLFTLLTAGCTPIGAYHENSSAQPAASIRNGVHHKLAFVEFGEQGSYQDTSQLDAAVDLIKRTPKPLVITYIHGWHNNANSNDVVRFEGMLEKLGQSKVLQSTGFHVVGVYIGWRGEITTAPVASELTFYSRKSAAERLASNYDCFDAIAAISEAARSYHKNEGQYTILMGHSFGGLAVERSVAHAINAEMHGHASSDQSLPADLILLLNPASDSILTRQMIAALYARHVPGNRQFIVSLTSSTDDATGGWFPLGTSLAATTKVFNRVRVPTSDGKAHLENERIFYTSTPGHNPFLQNHKTILRRENFPNPSGQKAFDFNLEHNHVGRGFVVDGKGTNTFQVWKFDDFGGPYGHLDVPYWDVIVDPSIIKDHGDIWNDKALAMMAAIFRMNFPKPLAAAGSKPSLLVNEAPAKAEGNPSGKPDLHREPDRTRLQYRQSQ